MTSESGNMTRSLMKTIVTAGNGGYEKLAYKNVDIPEIAKGEVLIKVLTAGVNNTDINTRLGWYSSSVIESTNEISDVESTQFRKHKRRLLRKSTWASLCLPLP